MDKPPSNDPLHGITLEQIVGTLVDHYGWEELGQRINIRCFNYDPSLNSHKGVRPLKFTSILIQSPSTQPAKRASHQLAQGQPTVCGAGLWRSPR